MFALMLLSYLLINFAMFLIIRGSEFRPSYKASNVLRALFPLVPILALTATATEQILTDIKTVRSADFERVCAIPDR